MSGNGVEEGVLSGVGEGVWLVDGGYVPSIACGRMMLGVGGGVSGAVGLRACFSFSRKSSVKHERRVCSAKAARVRRAWVGSMVTRR